MCSRSGHNGDTRNDAANEALDTMTPEQKKAYIEGMLCFQCERDAVMVEKSSAGPLFSCAKHGPPLYLVS